MTDNKHYWMWFAMAFRPGNERIWQMISPFGNVKTAYEAVCNGDHPALSIKERNAAKTTHIEQCDSMMEYCQKRGYKVISFEDENYPPLLRNIYNPPAVLFCMGDTECVCKYPAISCVGTRNPSLYSLEVTEKICSELAKREFTIVSGFALGLDSAAHKGAIEAGGRTAAVLACGLDVDYPKENSNAKMIIAKNGLVVSEYFPGTRPDRFCFQTRNRIISGMTFGTLITEADERSGALITAEHAADQGRTLFCIPPADIFDKRYAGVVKYLRDGAVPVFSHLDILYDYYTSGCFRTIEINTEIPEIFSEDNDIPKRDSRVNTRKRKKTINPPAQDEQVQENGEWEELIGSLSDEQLEVVKILEDGDLMLDQLIGRSGKNALSILAVLTELEIIGAVELKTGKKYGLTLKQN